MPVRPFPVRLDSIGVTFSGRSQPALDRFELTIDEGEHVALVGPSGVGKSTVLAVLLGFVAPENGTVSIGGVDLADIDPAAWRRHVAWVPQRPHLFGGTLAENLRLGDPDATPERLDLVLEATGLAGLAAALPAGLATRVGEGGITLSAGERQRVAVARAALRDAPLVLLDEPVAHLDLTTEAWLREALDPWLEGRTVLVAAHRPELVARIDRTAVLAGDAPEAEGRPVGAPA